MLFWCAVLLLICEQTFTLNFVINDNSALSIFTTSLDFVAHTTETSTSTFQFPYLFYVTDQKIVQYNKYNVQTVHQYNVHTKETTQVATNLLSVSGLAVHYPTLYILEMGEYHVDPAGRLSALSLVTGKQKVLLRIDEGDPRSLYFDPASSTLFYSLSNSRIMGLDTRNLQSSVVTQSYDIWAYGLCVKNQVLYIYNGRSLIAHNIIADENLWNKNVEKWNVLSVSGSTLCHIKEIEWPDYGTMRITVYNSSVTQSLHPPSYGLKDLIIFENRPYVSPDLSRCQNCDVCLGSEMLCACQYGMMGNSSCRSLPDKFIVMTQIETLSLLDTSDPATVHRLHINSEEPASSNGGLTGWTKQWSMRDVVLDSSSDTVFWIESTFIGDTDRIDESRIMKLRLGQSTTPEVVYHEPLMPVDSLALNSKDGLLYWLVSRASLVVAAKVSCTVQLCYKTIVVNRDLEDDTNQLEVSGETGYMVYVSRDNMITRRELDGGNSKVILSGNILLINCIALSGDYVYIIHSNEGKITRLPVAGGDHVPAYRQRTEFVPISMAVYGDVLFVVSELNRAVTMINLTSQESDTMVSEVMGLKSVDVKRNTSEGRCSIDNGGCQHFCFSLPEGNHRCGCADGYIMSTDGHTCQEPPMIYISVGEYIQRFHSFPVSGVAKRENVVRSIGAKITALDYFEDKECVVWIDANSNMISKTSLKGKTLPENGFADRVLLVNDGLVKPTDVSVDWISETVFWSDEERDRISMVTLEGDLSRTLVKHALKPTSLVVYPVAGKMFWIGWESHSAVVRSAGMDGSNVSTIVTKLSTWPVDITIDYQNERVVWVDARDKLVVSSSFDGTDIKYIFGSPRIRYPVALAVWYGSTYWADLHWSMVIVAEGTNAFDTKTIESSTKDVSDITLSHPGKQSRSSPCSHDNGGCTHVCVPTSSAARVCLCPDRMLLAPDRRTCKEVAQRMIGIDLKPYLLAVSSPPEKLSEQILTSAVKIAVHYEQQRIYWLDNFKSSIEVVQVNGTGYRTVYKGTYNATDIKIDWLGGNIYWTESDSKALKCVTLNGKFDKLLLETENPPRFLLLDPPRSKLFWMECMENGGTLFQSTMSGSNINQVLNTERCPESMDIARETGHIFWIIANKLYSYRYVAVLDQDDDVAEVAERDLYFPTHTMVWVEETLFLLQEDQGVRRMFGLDMPFETLIDVGNSTRFAAFSPHDAGYSACQIDNGGCTHFCFTEESGVKCGCPAQHTLQDNNSTCTKLGEVCDEETEFKCGSGECISRHFVCSSLPECIDHSDEVNCGWCASFQFSCGSKCVDSTRLCDGTLDCDDREDEVTCSPSDDCNGYKCKGTGVCLPARMKCNGVRECEQGDDERKCPRLAGACNELEWECNDGKCIKNTWLCDRHPDCSEGEDEHADQGCEACDPVSQFNCGDHCIDIVRKCDGIFDCKDSSDEVNCQACKKGQKECNNGQCRAANRWCDRTPDCSDRSDEWNCTYTIVESKDGDKQNHIAPTLIIIFASLFMSLVVVGLLYKFNVLPRVRSTYKQLTQSSNKTVETNVCVTTNTYSELETTVCSSDGAWQRRHNKSLDHYETITNSSVGSSLKPINTQNPYERFGIAPVQSTTDVSIADGPPPSVASGGYSSGPGASSRAPSRAPSTRSHAHSARSRATSARSRVPVSYHYHVNNNVIWDDNINSVSDYEQNCLSDNYQSEFSIGYTTSRNERLARNLAPCGTPVTTDCDD
ncbi:hypothetical protein ACHWQZ_G004694 [Mnemiopsis leidyi]